MRFPLLWIAGALAAGVCWGLTRPATPASASAFVFLPAILLLLALLMARQEWLRSAWTIALISWALLGLFAARVQSLSTPQNHVTSSSFHEQTNSPDALRWRGTLRSDPLRMPWGYRFEIDLDEVEAAGRTRSVTGGLRATYFHATGEFPSTGLRAGDRVEALLRARPPRNFQNPGAFDLRAQLARQGIHLTGSLRSLELLRRLEPGAPTFAHRAARIRGDLLQRIESLFGSQPDESAALRAILLGDYSFIDRDVAEMFQKTGAYHVLVISGLHVAALAAFVFWVARRVRLRLFPATLLTLLVLGAFIAIVEDRPPIERAALMSLLVLASGLLFRRSVLLNAIGAAAALIMAARPDALFDPSFQLSFLAGAMIGALGLPLVEATSAPFRAALQHVQDVTRDASHTPRAVQLRLDLRALAGWLAARVPAPAARLSHSMATLPIRGALALWDVFLISTAIQLGMLPVLAAYFHRVNVIGPLANIPAAVLSALLIPLGFAAVALSYAWSLAGALAAKITALFTTALLASVAWFGEWAHGSYRIPSPPATVTVGFFCAVGVVAWMLHARDARWRAAKFAAGGGALVALTATVAIYPFAPALSRQRLEATVLDVGQGDAIFVAFPNGKTMLLDGGGQYGGSRAGGVRTGLDIGEQVVSPYLWSRGLKRIDVLALSHAHQDHLDGLLSVLDNFSVGELWVSRDIRTPAFAALVRKAETLGVRVIHHRRGDSFAIGDVGGLVLWPDDVSAAGTAANNDSLVLRLEYRSRTFLLPGDIEVAVENELFAREDPLAADFVKIPHHGSRTSTTPFFAMAAKPEIAVISLGENNSFGHPHSQVLETLKALEASTYRTDLHGAVTISTDGAVLEVQPFAALPRSAAVLPPPAIQRSSAARNKR